MEYSISNMNKVRSGKDRTRAGRNRGRTVQSACRNEEEDGEFTGRGSVAVLTLRRGKGRLITELPQTRRSEGDGGGDNTQL